MQITQCDYSSGYLNISLDSFPELTEDAPAAVLTYRIGSKGKTFSESSIVVWMNKMLEVFGSEVSFRLDQPSCFLSVEVADTELGAEVEVAGVVTILRRAGIESVSLAPPAVGETVALQANVESLTGHISNIIGRLSAAKVGTKTEFVLESEVSGSDSAAWLTEIELKGPDPEFRVSYGELGERKVEISTYPVKKSALKDAALVVRWTVVSQDSSSSQNFSVSGPIQIE